MADPNTAPGSTPPAGPSAPPDPAAGLSLPDPATTPGAAPQHTMAQAAPARAAGLHWHRLDNTANLFPVITNDRFTNVYRLSLTLTQPVVPELLQQALERTLPWFAAFKVRMRRGLFWHYLEENPATPLVSAEDDYPCRNIDPRQNEGFLFHVSYCGCRVNLETFHVLSDGTGALQFLQAITCRYLMLAHPAAFTEEEKATRWFAGNAANTEDSYVSNYVPTKKANFRIGRGWRMRGERYLLDSLSVIHAHVALPGLLALCRKKGVSITQYLTACLGWAVYTQQMGARPPRHPLNIFVPVNLRNLFPSGTTLNFFSNIYITLPFTGPGATFGEVLDEVKAQFEQKVSREAMLEKISYTVGSGYSPWIRMVPLPLKNLFLRLVFQASVRSSSMGFSNVGRVQMPAPFAPWLSGASFMLSTTGQEPFKCAALSYGDRLTITFTSTLKSMALQREVVRLLSAEGLEITIESNGVDYESV